MEKFRYNGDDGLNRIYRVKDRKRDVVNSSVEGLKTNVSTSVSNASPARKSGFVDALPGVITGVGDLVGKTLGGAADIERAKRTHENITGTYDNTNIIRYGMLGLGAMLILLLINKIF